MQQQIRHPSSAELPLLSALPKQTWPSIIARFQEVDPNGKSQDQIVGQIKTYIVKNYHLLRAALPEQSLWQQVLGGILPGSTHWASYYLLRYSLFLLGLPTYSALYLGCFALSKASIHFANRYLGKQISPTKFGYDDIVEEISKKLNSSGIDPKKIHRFYKKLYLTFLSLQHEALQNIPRAADVNCTQVSHTLIVETMVLAFQSESAKLAQPSIIALINMMYFTLYTSFHYSTIQGVYKQWQELKNWSIDYLCKLLFSLFILDFFSSTREKHSLNLHEGELKIITQRLFNRAASDSEDRTPIDPWIIFDAQLRVAKLSPECANKIQKFRTNLEQKSDAPPQPIFTAPQDLIPAISIPSSPPKVLQQHSNPIPNTVHSQPGKSSPEIPAEFDALSLLQSEYYPPQSEELSTIGDAFFNKFKQPLCLVGSRICFPELAADIDLQVFACPDFNNHLEIRKFFEGRSFQLASKTIITTNWCAMKFKHALGSVDLTLFSATAEQSLEQRYFNITALMLDLKTNRIFISPKFQSPNERGIIELVLNLNAWSQVSDYDKKFILKTLALKIDPCLTPRGRYGFGENLNSFYNDLLFNPENTEVTVHMIYILLTPEASDFNRLLSIWGFLSKILETVLINCRLTPKIPDQTYFEKKIKLSKTPFNPYQKYLFMFLWISFIQYQIIPENFKIVLQHKKMGFSPDMQNDLLECYKVVFNRESNPTLQLSHTGFVGHDDIKACQELLVIS